MKIAKRPRDDAPKEIRAAYKALPKLERWGPGPWVDEPDRLLWKHEGLDCLINRGPVGSWCGYVAVPKSHPAFGKHYDDDAIRDIEVHGGLTYAHHCQGEICHPHDENEEPVFWFGFDCGHCYDLSPAMHAFRLDPTWPKFDWGTIHEIYRDQAFVTAETNKLAEQLAKMRVV